MAVSAGYLPAIRRAADILAAGGIVAYPTEGVYGLGCLADDEAAVARLIAVKGRDPGKGLILLVAERDALEDYVDAGDLAKIPAPDPAHPVTWIVGPGPAASPLVLGTNPGLAVRITTNPVARALCDAVPAPVTSTSANLSDRPVVRNRFILRRTLGPRVDFIVPGDCGPAKGPSEIRRLEDNRVLRPRTT